VTGADRLVEAVPFHAHRDRRRLAARDHQTIEALEIGGNADLARRGAQRRQHLAMSLEVALDGKDADPE
jgi:hypothetical protein